MSKIVYLRNSATFAGKSICIKVSFFSETESNSELAKNLRENTLKSKSDNHDNDENISFPFLKKIKSEHPKNLFFGQLNVNSIRNKFESVQEIIQNTFDIFLVCETKIDSSFPNQQFCIPEYRIFRKDRNVVEDYFSM